MRKKQRRGFSIVEVVVTIAVLAVIGGIAIPRLSEWVAFDQPRRVARGVLSDINRTRGLAVGGQKPGMLQTHWGPSDRTLSAGLVVSSPNTYLIFVDRNTVTDGDEYTVAIVTLPTPITITSPAVGQGVRFLQDGTTGAPTATIQVSDVGRNVQHTVTVSGAGLAWLD